jgi:iron complex outermembrane recepter protein
LSLPNKTSPLAESRKHGANVPRLTVLAAAIAGILCNGSALADTSAATDSSTTESSTTEASSPSDSGFSSLEEIVVTTQSRAASSTVEKSASPIDVVTSSELLATGQQNLRDALATLYPSYQNVAGYQGQQGEGVKVAALHGLDPKDTLVLVNGVRRHRTALYLNGEAPTDLDMIPASAVDHIEVLKDGAAAQYGSDAIAGVINIILKKDDQGGSATLGYGQYGSTVGDFPNLFGREGTALFNQGFKLGSDGGFFNVSTSVDVHKATNVYGPYPLTTNIYTKLPDGQPDPRETEYTRYRQIEGQPDVQNYSFAYNAELPINPGVTVYSDATYAHRYSQGWGFYRPEKSPQNYPDVYPNGYIPKFEDVEDDFQPTFGAKGDLAGWKWNASTSYGSDRAKIYTDDSINASLGPEYEDINNFYDGGLISAEWINDLDIARDLPTGLFEKPLNASAGLEFRRESFSVGPGVLTSYEEGTFVWPAGTPNAGIRPNPGASGMSGYSPAVSGSWDRKVEAAYVDLNQALTEKWTVDLAGRYEHYSEFGATESGKLATRYEFVPEFALRGTVSNGFSAPTLQQEHYSQQTGGYVTNPATGQLYQEFSYQAPPTSLTAEAVGATPLKPEHSIDYSVGFVLKPLDRTTLSLDAYQISISNRMIVTPTLQGPTVVDLLRAAGIDNVTSVTYVTNAAHTVTRGADLEFERLDDFESFGRVKWTVASNENVTTIKSLAGIPPVLANSGISWSPAIYSQLTQYYPRNVTSVGANWFIWKVDIDLTERHYTATDYVSSSGPQLNQHSSPAFITYLDVGYNIAENARLSIGANNLFDKRPDQQSASAIKYGSVPTAAPAYVWYSPYGNDGGYYYVRFKYSW